MVPAPVARLVHAFFGRFIESGAPEGGLMGATLEIQRAQQMEALEQQIIRQQVGSRPRKFRGTIEKGGANHTVHPWNQKACAPHL